MIGRRLQDNLTEWAAGEGPIRGDYWKTPNGWMCCTPSGAFGNLSRHQVTEHEDGTITVSPSILITSTRPDEDSGDMAEHQEWHGFLERGVWRSC